jgi:hypothetical protein
MNITRRERMKSLWNRLAVLSLVLVLVLLASSVPASAQIKLTGQTVKALSIERVLQLNNVLSTITPSAPPSVLAALAGGALEIREIITLNPISGATTSVVFRVPTGTPFPTPGVVDTLDPPPLGSNIATFILVPDKVYVTKSSVTFSGTILVSSPTPFGDYTGAPATLAFGLTNDTPPKITNVVELISGAVVTWSASGTGTVTLSTPATSPTGGTVTVAVTPANQTILTTLGHIDSKATDSADPNATFNYKWVLTSPAGGGANIFTPQAASTDVQLVAGFNTYTFTVTATNTKTGASGTGTATIQCACAERR